MVSPVPIQLLHDRVLVQEDGPEGERRSQGGILIPATAQVGKRLVWAGVVSVGPNKFGHPTPEMLALMARHHLPLLRTDRVGDITLTAGPNGLAVAEARPP